MSKNILASPVAMLASFRIFGIRIDIDSISGEIGLQPSDFHRQGERGPGSLQYGNDLWCLDSPYPSNHSLDVHLSWLRQVLLPRYDFLRSLKGSLELSIYCGVTVDRQTDQFVVAPEALKLFVELGIDMDLTVIFVGDQAPETITESQLQAEAFFIVGGGGIDVIKTSQELAMPSSHLRRADLEAADDMWLLAAPFSRTDILNSHFKWLSAILTPHLDFLRSLRPRSKMFIRCDLFAGSDIFDFSIPVEGLKLCTELGIPLECRIFLA